MIGLIALAVLVIFALIAIRLDRDMYPPDEPQ